MTADDMPDVMDELVFFEPICFVGPCNGRTVTGGSLDASPAATPNQSLERPPR
jgi:hypothetical protein